MCVWLLSKQYLGYYTHYAFSQQIAPYPFPALTICPRQPLNLKANYQHSPREWYAAQMQYLTNIINFEVNQFPQFNFQQYYQFFESRSAAETVGLTQEEVIETCRYSNSTRLSRTPETRRYLQYNGIHLNFVQDTVANFASSFDKFRRYFCPNVIAIECT